MHFTHLVIDLGFYMLGISIFALLLRNISYKYNKCASFFIEDIPASHLKSECAIYVSVIIDLKTLLKVS